MNTLAVEPLSPLLDRLFKEADAANSPVVAEWSREERLRLMQSKTEYLDFYEKLKDLWLPVSRETGRLLYLLARATVARNVVEFGTSFGISTLHLAAAVRDNGGGRVITTEFEPSKVARAKQHFAEGGLLDLVEVRAGDALQTLSANLPDSIDLLVLDGAKSLYGEVLALVEARLRPGAHRGRQRRLQPGVPGARAFAELRLSVHSLRRRRRAFDASRVGPSRSLRCGRCGAECAADACRYAWIEDERR